MNSPKQLHLGRKLVFNCSMYKVQKLLDRRSSREKRGSRLEVLVSVAIASMMDTIQDLSVRSGIETTKEHSTQTKQNSSQYL